MLWIGTIKYQKQDRKQEDAYSDYTLEKCKSFEIAIPYVIEVIVS